MDRALGFVTNGAFSNSGQNCAATSRILVPRHQPRNSRRSLLSRHEASGLEIPAMRR